MHKVPETGVQDSVAEPVQWAREEEEEKPGGRRREEEEKKPGGSRREEEEEPGFSNRKHELEKPGWRKSRRWKEEEICEQKPALLSLGVCEKQQQPNLTQRGFA